jgi:hypothetical protein
MGWTGGMKRHCAEEGEIRHALESQCGDRGRIGGNVDRLWAGRICRRPPAVVLQRVPGF